MKNIMTIITLIIATTAPLFLSAPFSGPVFTGGVPSGITECMTITISDPTDIGDCPIIGVLIIPAMAMAMVMVTMAMAMVMDLAVEAMS